MGVVVIAAGYLLGRLRPWQRAGDWAADQVRFTGAWVRGGTVRQAVVVLVHVVTAPRTSWRIMRAPAHHHGGDGARTRSGVGLEDPTGGPLPLIPHGVADRGGDVLSGVGWLV